MSTDVSCQKCGTRAAAGAPGGLCARCLILEGLRTPESDSDLDTGEIRNPLLRYFGDYELLNEIARGGMGVVYRARQLSLKRIVAVKLLPAGPLARRDYAARFRAEAETVAALKHPNIVTIYEIGEHEGQPYFSMDYVDGKTLGELGRGQPLPTTQAVTWLQTIAEAVYYAHNRGLVHRDLKPSNILIDPFDQPRLTDFGLAKWLQVESDLTVTGELLGTPSFMSPEQASGKKNSVGPASDIYSLGAILYFLLTGRPPFQAESLSDTLVQVRSTEPVRLSRLNVSVPPDVETICLKCLEKEPGKRYSTAQELANDLFRFAHCEPIRARPIGPAARVLRWCRRKPALASSFGALLLVFALGFGGVLWQPAGRKRALGETQKALTESRYNLYVSQMSLVRQAWEDGNIKLATDLLNAQRPNAGQTDLRGFEWRYFWQLCHDQSAFTWSDSSVDTQSVAVSPDGRLLATGGFLDSDNGAIAILNVADKRKIGLLTGHKNGLRAVVFAPNGTILASASTDRTVKLWDLATARCLNTLTNSTGYDERVVFSPEGKLLATGSRPDGTVRLWDWQRKQILVELIGPPNDRPSLAFSPDGKLLAFGSGERVIHLYDVATRRRISDFPRCEDLVLWLAFSSDGETLASASNDGTITLWEVRGGKLKFTFSHHKGRVTSVDFSPDGVMLASSCVDGTIKLWDMRSTRELTTFKGHQAWVNNVVFFPDGKTLASSSDDQTVKLWAVNLKEKDAAGENVNLWESDIESGNSGAASVTRRTSATRTLESRYRRITDLVNALAVSPDGKVLAAASQNETVKLFDLVSHQVATLHGHSDVVTCLAFFPDGRTLATGSFDRTVRLSNYATREELAILEHSEKITALSISADGKLLAAADEARVITLWDVVTRSPLQKLAGPPELISWLLFLPDGKTLAASGEWTGVYRWDWSTGSRLPAWLATGHASALALSADGRMLATGDRDNTAKIWDLATKRDVATLTGHAGWITSLAFSPDGKTLGTAGIDSIKLWNLSMMKEVATLPGRTAPFSTVLFSSDGKTLAAYGEDRILRLWHAPSFSEITLAESVSHNESSK